MKLKILVVDDSGVNRDLVAAILEDDFEVEVAADGYEAIAIFNDADFDCIVTDLIMPNMNGIEFAEKVREKNAKIPILLISASLDDQVIAEATNAGINNFLAKPFRIKELRDAVNKTIQADEILGGAVL